MQGKDGIYAQPQVYLLSNQIMDDDTDACCSSINCARHDHHGKSHPLGYDSCDDYTRSFPLIEIFSGVKHRTATEVQLEKITPEINTASIDDIPGWRRRWSSGGIAFPPGAIFPKIPKCQQKLLGHQYQLGSFQQNNGCTHGRIPPAAIPPHLAHIWCWHSCRH